MEYLLSFCDLLDRKNTQVGADVSGKEIALILRVVNKMACAMQQIFKTISNCASPHSSVC